MHLVWQSSKMRENPAEDRRFMTVFGKMEISFFLSKILDILTVFRKTTEDSVNQPLVMATRVFFNDSMTYRLHGQRSTIKHVHIVVVVYTLTMLFSWSCSYHASFHRHNETPAKTGKSFPTICTVSGAPLGSIHWNFTETRGVKKLQSYTCIFCHITLTLNLSGDEFSRFNKLPKCENTKEFTRHVP